MLNKKFNYFIICFVNSIFFFCFFRKLCCFLIINDTFFFLFFNVFGVKKNIYGKVKCILGILIYKVKDDFVMSYCYVFK